jgi:hypothetical protein
MPRRTVPTSRGGLAWRPGPALFGGRARPAYQLSCAVSLLAVDCNRKTSPEVIPRHLWRHGNSQPCTSPIRRTPGTAGSAQGNHQRLAQIAIRRRSLVDRFLFDAWRRAAEARAPWMPPRDRLRKATRLCHGHCFLRSKAATRPSCSRACLFGCVLSLTKDQAASRRPAHFGITAPSCL